MVAVVLVTWMIFWMRRTARRLKGELTGKLESALGVGALAVAGIAFVAVVREGLETALLFYAAAQGATSTADAAGGDLRRARDLGADRLRPLRRRDPGEPLAVLHRQRRPARLRRGRDPQVRHPRLPGGRRPARPERIAFDVSGVLDPTSWYGAAIAGMFNITARPPSSRPSPTWPTWSRSSSSSSGRRAAGHPVPDRGATAGPRMPSPDPENSQHVPA